MSNYLPLTGRGRIDGFLGLLRALAQSEKQIIIIAFCLNLGPIMKSKNLLWNSNSTLIKVMWGIKDSFFISISFFSSSIKSEHSFFHLKEALNVTL